MEGRTTPTPAVLGSMDSTIAMFTAGGLPSTSLAI